MKIVTKEYKVFGYDELSKDAQGHAVNDLIHSYLEMPYEELPDNIWYYALRRQTKGRGVIIKISLRYMIKLTQQQIKKVFSTKITQKSKDVGMFLHCRKCLPKSPKDMPEGESAHTYMEYEASTYVFHYPGGTNAGIFVLWCKKCGREVWDSRHLQPWL